MIHKLRVRLADQQGFTLAEMLAAMVSATIVMLATMALLDISVRESARATDRVEANQNGRTAMEELVQELHSSCVAATVTPVLAGSDATHLNFLSQFGSAAVLTPNTHVVTFAGGALTDTAYASTGGSAPNWTFSSTPTAAKTLAANVRQASIGGTTLPVFQYFKYVNGTLSTTPLPTPLSSTDAAAAVAVTISFAAGPSDGSLESDRSINLSDSVVLRYVPASGTTTVANLPCQ